MKKFLVLLLVAAMPFLIQSCCEASVLADLATTLVSGLVRTFVSSTANSQVFEVVNDFANVATDVAVNQTCTCGKKIQEAKASTAKWNVYYNASTPDPGNWGQPQVDADVDKGSLEACHDDKTIVDVEFLASGYYLVENILDYTNQVHERNEGNNLNQNETWKTEVMTNPFLENAHFGNNRNYTIIEVKLEQELPQYDAEGKRIFCRILSVK